MSLWLGLYFKIISFLCNPMYFFVLYIKKIILIKVSQPSLDYSMYI